MPLTQTPYPIILAFLCSVKQNTGMPAAPNPDSATTTTTDNDAPKQLPKGVVLGPDGKACRSCTSVASWMAMAKSAPSSKEKTVSTSTPPAGATSSLSPPADCPPDVEELGRSSWTLLHTMAASYPETPSLTQQSETRQFIGLFGKMYPCWVCAGDFQEWMRKSQPRVSSRSEFSTWMCEAHNAVNEKLGKKSFDCAKWEERWRTGWSDGRCG